MAKRKTKRSSTTSAWSDLPESLLYTILTLLPSIRDLASFSSVCRSWRTSSSSLFPTAPSLSASSSLFAPLLLYPLSEAPRRPSALRRVSSLRLHDPANPSVSYPLSFTSSVKKSLCSNFLACSHGHLIFIACNRIFVIDPFTGSQLKSPILTRKFNPDGFACLLTAPPSSDESALVLFSYGSFMQWRIGIDSSVWSSFRSVHKLSHVRLVSVNRRVYVIDLYKRFYVCELHPNLSLKDLQVDSLLERINFSLIDWIVDLGGELLFLQFEQGEEMMKAQCVAFRLEKSSWVKMESLGDWAVFVGPDSSVPGLACKNPERWGGRKNCIYFARNNDDGINGGWAEMELGEEVDICDPESPLSMSNSAEWPAPLWVYPQMVL
ncbi:hypothetical protein LUZ60_013225 [Juncus effusus]|nr:hypothetical protein LUZ60_013225 [Juncus effusus]